MTNNDMNKSDYSPHEISRGDELDMAGLESRV